MALGINEFLSAPFFTSSITPDPLQTSWVAGIVYKLNTMTGTLLFLLSCFVYVRELLDQHIHCITDGSDSIGQLVPLKAFESYCYIQDTFTLPKQAISKQGLKEIHPGIGPIGSNSHHEFIYHNYYMWVPYLLFIQSLSFYLPYVLHNFFQDGRVQLLLQDLQNLIPAHEARVDKYGDINLYFKDWYNHQDWWAIKVVICEVLNMVVIVLNILLVDWYLGHQFFSYGIASLEFIMTNVNLRGIDPFNILFPKMTKCSLETYGPSGSIQNFDGLCVLPVNVLNEKIYFLLWFVFLGVGLFTVTYTLAAAVIMTVKNFRNSFLLYYISPERRLLRRKLVRILNLSGFGDWMMLYMIARNTDRVVFGQLIEELNFPDYNHDLEPCDEENLRLDRLVEKTLDSDNEDIISKVSFVDAARKQKAKKLFSA